MSDLTQALIRVDELKADVSRLHGECDYLEAQLTIAMGAIDHALACMGTAECMSADPGAWLDSAKDGLEQAQGKIMEGTENE